jgi:RNA polymerase primary sigma factor
MLENQSKNAVTSYLNNLQNYPQLEHEEVVKLFQLYEKGGHSSDAARKKLAESNLRLVVYVAKKQKNSSIPLEDLIQEGNLGLLKAIDKFDWKKGFRFSTYATWWIKQAISQYVMKRKKIIRLPAHAVSAQKKMIEATTSFKESNGYDPNSQELAEIIDVSETIIKATIHSGKNIVSLEQPVGDKGTSTVADKIEDENPSNDPFEVLPRKEMLGIVREVMNKLSTKEAAILRLRFGLYEDVSAEQYQVTESEEKQIASGEGLK